MCRPPSAAPSWPAAPTQRPRPDANQHVADHVPGAERREAYGDAPKTDAGTRTIALDPHTEWGSAWAESVRVFTEENGEMLPLPTSPPGAWVCWRTPSLMSGLHVSRV